MTMLKKMARRGKKNSLLGFEKKRQKEENEDDEEGDEGNGSELQAFWEERVVHKEEKYMSGKYFILQPSLTLSQKICRWLCTIKVHSRLVL